MRGITGTYLAEKWVTGYFRALKEFTERKVLLIETKYSGYENENKGYYDALTRDTSEILKKSAIVANRLKSNMENAIDSKIKEFPKIRQLMQNFRGDRRDFYSVDLDKVVIKTLDELGLSSKPAQYIDSISKVAPHYFSGFSLLDERVPLNEFNLLGKKEFESFFGEYTGKYTKLFNAHPFEYRSAIGCCGSAGDICSWFVSAKDVKNIINARLLGIDVSTIRAQRDIIENRERLEKRCEQTLQQRRVRKMH
jgi:hypothetical protein